MIGTANKSLLLFLLIFFMPFIASAQFPDSIRLRQTPKVPTSSKKILKKDTLKTADIYPNPRKAALYALIIPGGGQVYNKDFWKVPLVYGAYYGLYVVYKFNNTQYNTLRNCLINRRETDVKKKLSDPCQSPRLNTIDERSLIAYRDQYNKIRQQSILGLVLVHILSATEAYVDAHLKNFDIDDNLSIQLMPKMKYNELGAVTDFVTIKYDLR
jgi:Family of unknown function (DUF5683)